MYNDMKEYNKLFTAVLVSFVVHLFIVVAFILAGGRIGERPFGGDAGGGSSGGVIAVDISSDDFGIVDNAQTGVEIKEKQFSTAIRERKVKVKAKVEAEDNAVNSGTGNGGGKGNGSGSGDGDGSGNGVGTGGDGGTNRILAEIRAKIERAKDYPKLAKRMRLEGRPTVLFEINSDGSVKYVKVAGSSGEAILDEAAVETVKRAAPLPYYERPIRLAIRYDLK